MRSETIKIVVVGDANSQKAQLMLKFAMQEDKQEGRNPNYQPVLFENMTKSMLMHTQPVNLALWDTTGQEPYEKLRPLAYHSTDVFLIAFSKQCSESYFNALNKWFQEVTSIVPQAKIIFVGILGRVSETETLDQESLLWVTEDELAQNIKKQTHCRYRQVDLENGQGVDQLFQTSARLVLDDRGVIDTADWGVISHFSDDVEEYQCNCNLI